MRRYAVPLVITGSLVVLGAGFLLLKTISASPAEPPPTTAPHQPTASTEPRPATQAPAASRSRIPLPGPPRRRDPGAVSSTDSTGTGGPPPTLQEEQGPPGTRWNTKNLEFGSRQLRAQIAANTEKIRECVRDSGLTPSGDATLTFIVGKQQDKTTHEDAYVVEQTNLERDATTLQGEALLECMQQAATAMHFVGLPREADAIIVTRAVKLVDGQVAEDKYVKFSYIR
jgi:hypothetical protein